MVDIKKNTVSADGQMKNSSELYFLGREDAPRRILIMGNSITRHGPNADIGWHGDWGMAASAPEHDYVHQLYAMLCEAGEDVRIMVRQASFWERHLQEADVLSHYEDERDFKPDVFLFRLGENVPEDSHAAFADALRQLSAFICPPSGRIVYTTCFWWHDSIDADIATVARERGQTCLNIHFAEDHRTMALGQFAHEGVAMHPSDFGMKCIAKAIFDEIHNK